MAFITQTPISDQIQNSRIPGSYSNFDQSGQRWDSLRNHDLNERPFSTPNPSNSYDVFILSEGSQTPISNQLNLQNYTTDNKDFSGIASATWTQYNVTNNRIPLIQDNQSTINSRDYNNYFSDAYKNSKLYTQGSATSDLTSGIVGGLVSRVGSEFGIGAASIPGLFKNAYGEFETLDYDQLKPARFAGQLQDFRQFKKSKNVRVDGVSAATKLSSAAIKMVAANAAALTGETGGTYQIFDRETYFGMGFLGDPTALRKDFTIKTEASTKWKNGEWTSPINLSTLLPFRGDKVTVRDFAQGDEKQVYKWKRGLLDKLTSGTGVGKVINTVTEFIGSPLDTTRDFIKFHFLGPITGKPNEYDIFAFRSTITSLTDSFSPSWQPIEYIGRADKSYLYASFDRSLDLQFSIYASSRDELKPMWRKLNYLATYTMPEYSTNYVTYRGKYLRVTIGDIFNKQPALITSLTYTLVDNDTTWEINLEDDPTNKQVPMRVNVTMGLTMLTDHLPQYKGQAYSLYNGTAAENVEGDENWLSDAVTVIRNTPEESEEDPAAGITNIKEKGRRRRRNRDNNLENL